MTQIKKTIFKRVFLVSIVVILIGSRYIIWEVLSYKHSNEFYQPIINDIEKGCLIEPAKYIKVLNYSSLNAKVFIKGISGSTWIINFQKINNNWTHLIINNNKTICLNEIINSTKGSSADGIFWYW